MRQIGGEKDDPLKRIQEEINEVARREQELREKMQLQQKSADSHESPSPMPTDEASNCAGTEEVHSDDSGISASSSPINGTSANTKPAYIRPSSYSVSAKLPQQKFLLRASSTPQITLTGRRFNISPAQKGIMQRFIASRGKLGTPTPPNNQYMHSAPIQGRDNGNPLTIELNRNNLDFLKAPIVTPPIIERDQDGRPIRRGFVPVEEKIQKELRDLKTRESELKRQRKLRQSQPDILDSIEDEEYQSDDSDVEHCFAPGKLRATKSISELCDNTSISPSITPSPNFDRKTQNHQGMRPAISLAQLCDLDPEEAPSSHDLIAKWESLIQKNA